jgi:pre-rRNA-processing protein RIX1
MLIHPYQTLVREIASPTIPAFSKACIQTIKAPSSDQLASIPPSIIETVCDSFSTLIPLYPATFRPSTAETYATIRSYLAPTSTDELIAPVSLQQAAQRLAIRQHFAAAKSGGSDDWARFAGTVLNQFHSTADQVFRAVDESWEDSDGRTPSQVDLDQEPHGGSSATNEFPAWTGIEAGAQRLAGLLRLLSAIVENPTKGAVVLPLTKMIDTISRVCLIARLSPKTQTWDQSLQLKAAISREEKEELWSAMPDLHIACLCTIRALASSLQDGMLPVMPEVLDHLVRIFNSGIAISGLRAAGYAALNDLMAINGPALSKPMVDGLSIILRAACRDLQEDAGHIKSPAKATASTASGKKNGLAANADLFLQKPQDVADATPPSLDPEHRVAALSLLASSFSALPQQHLKPSLRSLLDQTTVLIGSREAMLSSVLNPYTDQRGRQFPSILPHLTQQYPHDQGLEILRTNLRTDIRQLSAHAGSDNAGSSDENENDEDEEMGDATEDPEGSHVEQASSNGPLHQGSLPPAPVMDVDLPAESNPFESANASIPATERKFEEALSAPASPPKRKYEGSGLASPKRQELQRPIDAPTDAIALPRPTTTDEDDENDSDGSVHLNMELEDDEDEDDD